MARIYTLVNQKGGVGKTTSSVNLAASLKFTRKDVLLIDLDPQGNATMGSGVDKSSLETSIYDVLMQHPILVAKSLTCFHSCPHRFCQIL